MSYRKGYEAGAASRDAEVAELSHKAFYVSSDHKDLIVENAKLREQVSLLRDALIAAESHLIFCRYGDSYERVCAKADKLPTKIAEALATTELK